MASGSIAKLDDKYINKAEDYLTKADLSSVEVENRFIWAALAY